MNTRNIIPMRRGYKLGLLSGLTWGIDTTLLALALVVSPFSEENHTLLSGIYVCCMIHILFETLYMSGIVSVTGGFRELRSACRSRGGIVCILGAICGGPFAMTCYLMAIDISGAPLTTTVTATYPLIGALLAMTLLKEKSSLQVWLGMLIAVFGILYAGTGMTFSDRSLTITGCIMACVTAVGWGFEGVACRYATHFCGISPKVALLLREYTCLIAYFAIAPFFLGGIDHMMESVSSLMMYWDAFAIVAVASCFGALSMYLWYRSINDVNATRGLCMNVTYCVWTGIFAIFLFHNVPATAYTLGGALMTVAGVALALWDKTLIGAPVPELDHPVDSGESE